MKTLAIALLGLSLSAISFSQTKDQAIHNADVVKMAQAGLPAEVIIAKIKASQCDFDTAVPALASLTKDGVPANVIAAMVSAKSDTSDGKVRVYVTAESTKSRKWGVFANHTSAQGAGVGGTDPQRDELIKTMMQRCPAVSVTVDKTTADFFLDMQREPNKGFIAKRNKWRLSDHGGDVVAAGSDRSVGSVTEDACAALKKVGAIPSNGSQTKGS